MRLRKRGNKYSIVWDEGDKQVYKPTGCTNREDAELVLAKERKNLERRRQGLPPINDKSDMTFLDAVDGFAHTKRRLSRDRHKTIRRRLLAIGYEVLTGKRLGKHIRRKVMAETVEPLLATRLLLEIRPENLEPWIDDQFEHGNGKYGHTGSTYKTVKEKVRQIEELFDYPDCYGFATVCCHRRPEAVPDPGAEPAGPGHGWLQGWLDADPQGQRQRAVWLAEDPVAEPEGAVGEGDLRGGATWG